MTLLPEALLNEEIEAICSRYRIDSASVRQILLENFAKNPALIEHIRLDYPTKEIKRLKAYKKVIKASRKQIYFQLRRYHRDPHEASLLKQALADVIQAGSKVRELRPMIDKLLQTHISTYERVESYASFYKQLFQIVGYPKSILDVGCGIHPLSYPFENVDTRPDRYVAIDNDQKAIDVLLSFATCAGVHPVLRATCADISQVDWIGEQGSYHEYDLVFMLKLIPVLYRQQPSLLSKLIEIPAKYILVTASKESLTRKEDISHREDRVLKMFIKMSHRKIVDKVIIENEFGYFLG